MDLADPGADLFDVPGRKFITWVYGFPKMGYLHRQHPQFQWIQVAPFLDKAIWKQGTYWHSPRLYGNMYVQYFPFLNSIPNQKSGQEFFLNAVVNLNKGTWKMSSHHDPFISSTLTQLDFVHKSELRIDTGANFSAWGARILSPSTSIIDSFRIQEGALKMGHCACFCQTLTVDTGS